MPANICSSLSSTSPKGQDSELAAGDDFLGDSVAGGAATAAVVGGSGCAGDTLFTAGSSSSSHSCTLTAGLASMSPCSTRAGDAGVSVVALLLISGFGILLTAWLLWLLCVFALELLELLLLLLLCGLGGGIAGDV